MRKTLGPSGIEVATNWQDLGDQVKLYTTRMRLLRAVDQADALDGIREIAENLVGTQEIAIFKVDKTHAKLWLYWSCGVDPNKHSALEVNREPRVQEVLKGKPVFRSSSSNETLTLSGDLVNALIPILVSGKTVAVIALFRLFSHKPALEPVDHEICGVLSSFGGRAIEPHYDRHMRSEVREHDGQK